MCGWFAVNTASGHRPDVKPALFLSPPAVPAAAATAQLGVKLPEDEHFRTLGTVSHNAKGKVRRGGGGARDERGRSVGRERAERG